MSLSFVARSRANGRPRTPSLVRGMVVICSSAAMVFAGGASLANADSVSESVDVQQASAAATPVDGGVTFAECDTRGRNGLGRIWSWYECRPLGNGLYQLWVVYDCVVCRPSDEAVDE